MNRIFFTTLLISLFMSSCYYTEEADLLIHNAKIYTVDNAFSIKQAMAVKDGKIIEIGPNNELKNRYRAKEEIDAKLKYIYPGFIDAHCHFLWYGNTFFEVDLVGTKSWEEVIERTKAFAEKHNDLWIKGRGWDQNDWEIKDFPNKKALDSLFPDRPVLLKRIDGHAAIANQKALEIGGITSESTIEGGIYVKENGELTGILIDNAVDQLAAHIPPQTTEEIARSLLKAEEMCFAKGLTTLSDAYTTNKVVHIIDSMQQGGHLKIKVYAMLSPTEDNKTEFLYQGPYQTERLNIRSFKYFSDGALGSRGAKLLEPYQDDPENTGLFIEDSSYFETEAGELHQYGYQ